MTQTASISATVAANARAEMARAGLSGRKMAEKLGWSESTLARRLRGEAFKVDELIAFAAALDIPVAQLMPASTDRQQVSA